jgi:hypothetical protein
MREDIQMTSLMFYRLARGAYTARRYVAHRLSVIVPATFIISVLVGSVCAT